MWSVVSGQPEAGSMITWMLVALQKPGLNYRVMSEICQCFVGCEDRFAAPDYHISCVPPSRDRGTRHAGINRLGSLAF